jgi:hypothetical protein
MKTVRQSLGWPIIIVAAGIAVVLIVMADLASPLRPLLVFGYLLVCPGMAYIRLLHLQDRFAEFVLAVALSLAIDTLVSEMLVLMRIWSLAGGVIAIVTVSIAGVVLQLIAARRSLVGAGGQR